MRYVIYLATLLSVVVVNVRVGHAGLVLETATMGPTDQEGGWALEDAQFIAARFSLNESYDITSIGGHLSTYTDGSVWGAIISLPSNDGLPAFSGSDVETHAWVSALFSDGAGANSNDYRAPVSATLPAGDYALLFGGGGHFGSTDVGNLPFEGQSDLPDASYFYWNGHTWLDGGLRNARFVVEGTPTAQAVVPEAKSLIAWTICLAAVTLLASKRRHAS